MKALVSPKYDFFYEKRIEVVFWKLKPWFSSKGFITWPVRQGVMHNYSNHNINSEGSLYVQNMENIVIPDGSPHTAVQGVAVQCLHY